MRNGNWIIDFIVYFSLIFIAAKFWDKTQASWLWVFMPMIVLLILEILAALYLRAKKAKAEEESYPKLKDFLYNLERANDTQDKQKELQRYG